MRLAHSAGSLEFRENMEASTNDGESDSMEKKI